MKENKNKKYVNLNYTRSNHIYFVSETKGNMETLDLSLRKIEKIKTECAKLHFKSICGDDITYGVVDSLDGLLNILKK